MRSILKGFEHRSLQVTWRNIQRITPAGVFISLLILLQSLFFPEPNPSRIALEFVYQILFVAMAVLYSIMWATGRSVNRTGQVSAKITTLFVACFLVCIFGLSVLDNVNRTDMSAVCVTLFVLPVMVHMSPRLYQWLIVGFLVPLLGVIGWVDQFGNYFWSASAQGIGFAVLSFYMQKTLHQSRLDRYMYQVEILDANAKLLTLSTRDPLTGLINRKQFDSMFHAEWQRSKRHTHIYSLVLFEMKMPHGGVVGDELLHQIGLALQTLLRRSDCAARFDASRFVILLAETNVQGAAMMKGRLQFALSQLAFVKGMPDPLTIQIGVASSSEVACEDDLLKLTEQRFLSGK